MEPRLIPIAGQGAAFLAAVGRPSSSTSSLSVAVSMVTKPKPVEQLAGCLLRDAGEDAHRPERGVATRGTARTVPLAGVALAMVIVLNVVF